MKNEKLKNTGKIIGVSLGLMMICFVLFSQQRDSYAIGKALIIIFFTLSSLLISFICFLKESWKHNSLSFLLNALVCLVIGGSYCTMVVF